MSEGFHVHGPHDHEAEHRAQHDPFAGRIAVMTAIFATVGAFMGYMGGATQNAALLYKNESAIRRTEASDQWNFYQAKSNKQNLAELGATLTSGELQARYAKEVERYIEIWRKNPRFADGLRQAESQHLPSLIARTMLEQHMPPQFFYVALQESDFRPHAVGPETSFGIAKGIWQLMPQTASRYGLRTGPLLGLPQFDPDDERFDPAAATQAAARYLRDLYRGEAQASGLLVLASYNWGPTRVRKLIRAMKENPRDRNFWALLAQKDIPKETRDYVFLIFAAAVIGEDPKLFGFDFEKPLTDQSKAGP
jgi:soluble lytic murein transglycosylase-like protein